MHGSSFISTSRWSYFDGAFQGVQGDCGDGKLFFILVMIIILGSRLDWERY
jgi:hypothetical protein